MFYWLAEEIAWRWAVQRDVEIWQEKNTEVCFTFHMCSYSQNLAHSFINEAPGFCRITPPHPFNAAIGSQCRHSLLSTWLWLISNLQLLKILHFSRVSSELRVSASAKLYFAHAPQWSWAEPCRSMPILWIQMFRVQWQTLILVTAVGLDSGSQTAVHIQCSRMQAVLHTSAPNFFTGGEVHRLKALHEVDFKVDICIILLESGSCIPTLILYILGLQTLSVYGKDMANQELGLHLVFWLHALWRQQWEVSPLNR